MSTLQEQQGTFWFLSLHPGLATFSFHAASHLMPKDMVELEQEGLQELFFFFFFVHSCPQKQVLRNWNSAHGWLRKFVFDPTHAV